MGKKEILQLAGVSVGGLSGGVGFWLLAAYSSTPVFTSFSAIGKVAALTFLGLLAALIGVYLLTSSDLKSMRTYIFALVCGLVWQPIITAGKQVVTNAAVKKDISKVNTSTEQLRAVAGSGSKEAIEAQIQITVQDVVALSERSNQVQVNSLREDASAASKGAIDALRGVLPKAPQSVIEGLGAITIEASNANVTSVAISGVQTLQAIERESTRSNQGWHTLADERMATIANQVSNRTVVDLIQAEASIQ